MPISIKQFEKGDFEVRNTDRTNHPITVFLRKNGGKAFTIKELSRNIKIKESTIRSMLSGLKKDGLVRHKSPYFAYKKK